MGFAARPAAAAVGLGLAVALIGGACARPEASPTTVPDPPASVQAKPDYSQACSPSGPDSSRDCLQVTLQAIDNARARERVKPMALPADFGQLSVPQQLFVAVNAERVDRGLPPFAGLSPGLSANAATGAAASRLPGDPGRGYAGADAEWIGDVSNALDADYEWMYDDGPGSVDGCRHPGEPGCWADRHIILDDFGSQAAGGGLVMGAAFDPRADTTSGDVGGTSLAATFAASTHPVPLDYTGDQVRADIAAGTLAPVAHRPANESGTHIPDPPQTVPAVPDYTQTCAPSGLDSSSACIGAVLAAVNHARAMEGVKPMVLPTGYSALSIPEQIFVAVNLERVDRGLAPFAALTAPLNANAQQGANVANDPPDPGGIYDVVDTEWAGGTSNGLDADYGWMYDDGIGSGNLDCPKNGGPGCWGHRHGILDDFGSVGTLVMGAAVNPTADTGDDAGGPSMAASLAITSKAAGTIVYTWDKVMAALASP